MQLHVLSWDRDLDLTRPQGPRGWGNALALIAAELGPEDLRWAADPGRPGRESVAFAWHPGIGTLRTALLTRRLVYLCWGFARTRNIGLKAWANRRKMRLIVRGAPLVLCNDTLTRDGLKANFGIDARLVRFPVDTAYFSEGPRPAQRPDVLIPGSNDRDEALARDLALRGISVLRVTQSDSVASWHAEHPVAGLRVLRDIPFAELRTLYQSCRAVILPLRETYHAAGQTAALEALASGARLIISDGFTSTIVAGYAGVTVLPGQAGPEEWIGAIEARTRPEGRGPGIAAHAPEKVAAEIAALIREAMTA